MDTLPDEVLGHVLLRAPDTAALQALCVASKRLRDTVTSESFQAARVQGGWAGVEVELGVRDASEDEDDDEDVLDPLGSPGEMACTRHIDGAILFDGMPAGDFQCILVDRVRCYNQGVFLSACDAESQELIDVGKCLFDAKGLPRYAPLKADAAARGGELFDSLDGAFLYISKFELHPARLPVPAGDSVPAGTLAALAARAIKALLWQQLLADRWGVAAYVGDGGLRTYETAPAKLSSTDEEEDYRRRKLDDCRPFVMASFDEIERCGGKDGCWLFTTQARVRGGTTRSAPLRAEAPPDPASACSAAPAGLHKDLLDAVLRMAPSLQPGDDAGLQELLDAVHGHVAAGASLNRSFALHAAVYLQQPALVTALAQLGASVDARDSSGLTPLMVAARRATAMYHPIHHPHDDTTCVDVLLALGADRSLTDPDGCSALGCYRQTQRDSNDFMATMGIGARRGANLALEAKLTPPAGPTAADADAELE